MKCFVETLRGRQHCVHERQSKKTKSRTFTKDFMAPWARTTAERYGVGKLKTSLRFGQLCVRAGFQLRTLSYEEVVVNKWEWEKRFPITSCFTGCEQVLMALSNISMYVHARESNLIYVDGLKLTEQFLCITWYRISHNNMTSYLHEKIDSASS